MHKYTEGELHSAAHRYVNTALKPMTYSALVYVLLLVLASYLSNIIITILLAISEAFFAAFWLSVAEKCASYGITPTKNLWDAALKKTTMTVLVYIIIMVLLSTMVGIPLGLCIVHILNGSWPHVVLASMTLVATAIVLYISVRLQLSCVYAVHNPSASIKQILINSWIIMENHITEYIVYKISYIGWIVLTAATLGLAGIYVFPLIFAADEAFYRSITNQPLYGPIDQ